MQTPQLKQLRYFFTKWYRRGWTLFFVGLVVVQLLPSPAIALTPKSYDELEFPPLPELSIPDYERYELNNGMVIYLMEDHRLPLVSGSAIMRTGSRLEPAEQVGLAGITGTVMRSGGTLNHPADTLNNILEQRAASIETSIGEASGSASFSALKEDFDLVFDLFAEVLQQPAFPQDKLDLAKRQTAGSISRRNDEPDAIAGREFSKLIYGADSPYARTTEYATLANIERDDLIAFYRTYIRPDQMILGIVGDIDKAATKAKIEAVFGSWTNENPGADLTPPAVDQPARTGAFLVDQPQLTQSSIFIGHQGGQLSNPDYAELSVMNGVLNGFGGRLFNEIRSRQGLAYSVYGVWSPGYDYDGQFIAGGSTRTEATIPFITALKGEMQRIQTEPITQAELAYAKDSILNSFVFNFADPSQTLSRLMRYEYYDYPADFIFQYQQEVEATTIADVQRVAQTYLKPDELTVLVVGNGAGMDPSLTSIFSEVTPVDITIPE
ncbi:pitrilysin family protein [Picosynechococcus sp. NKBG15041c]|uniref:M16 family metallopeptidase n=1 Tax=Picosynechococcus sp. NKBG15041c TaxID=1407650 RepID=UPI00046391A1|nr:pitrilysin family protein [Picosynechococcus sp. NKBG15041c]